METALRRDALACLRRGIEAVEPSRLVSEFLSGLDETDRLPSHRGAVSIIAIGKAAGTMAAGAASVLGERLAGGVLIVPAGQETAIDGPFEVHGGGHPIPSPAGVAGAEAVASLARRAGADDLLLHLVSGGGSALMTLPPDGITLADVQATTDLLLRAGATIAELNCVRKHLDRLKGGRLARLAAPAQSLGLVLSDVIGDPLDVIASGPLSPDPTTFTDAHRVLEQYALWKHLPTAVRRHLAAGARGRTVESPKNDDPCFSIVSTRIVGSNSIAADAVVAEATRRGYVVRLLTTSLTGEAREVGRDLATQALQIRSQGQPPQVVGEAAPHRAAGIALPACLVAAGETTVTVHGAGSGGRNQELALGAAVALDGHDGCLIASIGTDGIDGPTDAAGACADGSTLKRARALGRDADAALADNDTYPFFRDLGDLIVTGPTGTNVMDLQIALIRG